MEGLTCRNLPADLVVEILLKSPVKSLVRFKRVCKSWRDLINDPLFANKHLRASMENGKSSSSVSFLDLLTYKEYPLTRQIDCFSSKRALLQVDISSGVDGNIRCVTDQLDLPQILKEKVAGQGPGKGVEIGDCNGIVCIVSVHSCPRFEVALCNPVLNEVVFLPSFPRFKVSSHGFGFGYDPTADDYKFFWVCKGRAHSYSLRTGSWTLIKIDKISKIPALSDKGVCCRGVYYWGNFAFEASKKIVLAFDISEEEFHGIPVSNVSGVHDRSANLAVWKESVVLFNSVVDDSGLFSFEMWVLVGKFGGVEGETSWIKHLTIEPMPKIDIFYPLEFWKDEELLVENGDGRLLSYNLHTNKVRTIPIDLMVSSIKHVHVTTFTKSLVSVKRGNMVNR